MAKTRKIDIAPVRGEITVRIGGTVVARTPRAVELCEEGYGPVVYVPRADVKLELFERSERTTHCPYKGDANYYSLAAGGQNTENIAWTYETPLEQVSDINGHLAFYTDRAEIERSA